MAVLGTIEEYRPYTIVQRLSAGANFDGKQPISSEVPVINTQLITSYATASSRRGLINFCNTTPIRLLHLGINLADQSSWVLKIVTDLSEGIILAQGENDFGYQNLIGADNVLILFPKWHLKLITTGGVTSGGLIRAIGYKPVTDWPAK